MKKYQVKMTVEVDVALIIDAPDQEVAWDEAERWYDLPQCVKLLSLDTGWAKPYEVSEFTDNEFIPMSADEVRQHFESIENEFLMISASAGTTMFPDYQQPIGAYADVRWLDSGEVVNRYFSFGGVHYVGDDPACDEFGVPDERIFFYVDNTQGFEALFSEDNGNDFVVLPDTVEYVIRPISV
jgi:hypothetical protein